MKNHTVLPNITIEAAQKVIPSRYTLMRVAALRVREIMAGSHPHPDVDSRLLNDYRRTAMPGSRAMKVAINEIEKGKVHFIQKGLADSNDDYLVDNVFTV